MQFTSSALILSTSLCYERSLSPLCALTAHAPLRCLLSVVTSSTATSMLAAASSAETAPPTDPVLAHALLVLQHRLVARERDGRLQVPKSKEHWIAVGVFVASRDFPDVPFFVPFVEPASGRRLDLPVPYKSIMARLSPKYNDRDRILLHTRVVQRRDLSSGRLFGEVRYICTDIAVSYRMGDNAFKWIIFQSVRCSCLEQRALCTLVGIC